MEGNLRAKERKGGGSDCYASPSFPVWGSFFNPRGKGGSGIKEKYSSKGVGARGGMEEEGQEDRMMTNKSFFLSANLPNCIQQGWGREEGKGGK